MSILCAMFGHRSKRFQYGAITSWRPTDGTGIEHASFDIECERCGEKYEACRVHLPARDSEKKLLSQNEELRKIVSSFAVDI